MLQKSKNNLQKTILKINFWGMSLFVVLMLSSFSNVSAQQNFDKFLVNFKKAVVKNDKKSVVRLTTFPLSYMSESISMMDEGSAERKEASSLSKRKFLEDYAGFFDESNIKCFKNSTFAVNNPDNKDSRSIECRAENRSTGFIYGFSKTKAGWKLSSIAIA